MEHRAHALHRARGRVNAPRSLAGEHTPETVEYGITSFVYRARLPFHPVRLQAALGCRPRTGALASLLRLKGFAWLATQPTHQMHAALAGTTFTMNPGPPWMAALLDGISRAQWPEDLQEQMAADLFSSDGTQTWDAQHGDRRTELVCIGRELDHKAATEQLEACLLTTDEMAVGKRRWLALTDPYADPHEKQRVERDLRLADGVLVALLLIFPAVVFAVIAKYTGDTGDDTTLGVRFH